MIKLNLGCGKKPLDGYINVDKYVIQESILNADILQLPFPDCSVDEIVANHVFEHVSLGEEKVLWHECYRVLKPGGILQIEVPDLEWLCAKFLAANDNFVDFYQVGPLDHYFGNGFNLNERWSPIATGFWGNQNGPGQFHKTGYTIDKLKRIAQLLHFQSLEIMTKFNKNLQVISGVLIK